MKWGPSSRKQSQPDGASGTVEDTQAWPHGNVVGCCMHLRSVEPGWFAQCGSKVASSRDDGCCWRWW